MTNPAPGTPGTSDTQGHHGSPRNEAESTDRVAEMVELVRELSAQTTRRKW